MALEDTILSPRDRKWILNEVERNSRRKELKNVYVNPSEFVEWYETKYIKGNLEGLKKFTLRHSDNPIENTYKYCKLYLSAFSEIDIISDGLSENLIELNALDQLLSSFPIAVECNPSKEETLKMIMDFLENIGGSFMKLVDYNKRQGIERCRSIKEILICERFQQATISGESVPSYKFISVLGYGREGITFLAKSREHKKYRAIKVKRSSAKQEANILSIFDGESLDNIVRFYEVIFVSDRFEKGSNFYFPGIVMEYVEGMTVRDYSENSLHSNDEIMDYSFQIFRGICELRKYGITHRDLNPNNIKINMSGKVKILDFGIATSETNPNPKSNRRYGGPNDIFSLGLITYKMVTGEHLILRRNDVMTSQEYANKIQQLKLTLYDLRHKKSLKIKKKYRKKINKKIKGTLKQIIFACLEGEDITSLKKIYIMAKKDKGYGLMTKVELINRICELEQEKGEV